VVVFGLPYANCFDVELKEKMKFFDQQAQEQKDRTDGNTYYQNLCIKAVNQSIGRAIRHKNDYSLVFLVDQRYQKDHIKGKLSGWVQNKMTVGGSVMSVKDQIQQFYSSKSTKK